MKRNSDKIFTGKIHGALATLLSICLVLVVMGCGKDDGVTGPEMTTMDLVYEGWDLFEDAEYAAAIEYFERALQATADLTDDQRMYAYSGAGWTCGKLPGRLEDARDYFERSVIDSMILYDALAGWLFVDYQLGDWNMALLKAEVLMEDIPTWRFYHEETLDYNDIRLLMAASHFNLGNFSESLQVVVEHLNSWFEADVSTQQGRRELSEEIERLREVYG